MEKRYPATLLCASCVPWTSDFKLDEAAFRRETEHLIEGGVKSIYILGTAGEGYAMDTKMFTEVTRVFLDTCKGGEDIMPMIGIISTSMAEMIERIEIAAELGARDFQIAFPCWGALNDAEALTFFRTVCGRFPELKFIHYNNGPRSKTKITAKQYTEIAPQVPNLVGAKYSTGNLGEIYELAKADCPVTFFLVDTGYAIGAMMGTFGFLNSFASLDLPLSWEFFKAGQEKDYEKLIMFFDLYNRIAAPLSAVGRPMIDAAYDKTIERVADPSFPNHLYPPYEGLTEEEYRFVDREMKKVLREYREKH